MPARPNPYASRKLVASTLTAGAIMVVGVLAAFLPAMAPSVPSIVGGLVATLVTYCGGNVAATVAVGKAEALVASVPAGKISKPDPDQEAS